MGWHAASPRVEIDNLVAAAGLGERVVLGGKRQQQGFSLRHSVNLQESNLNKMNKRRGRPLVLECVMGQWTNLASLLHNLGPPPFPPRC
jgi:hypothetical protein